MVANLTVGKKKYVEVEAEMKELSEEAAKLQEKLVALIDKDAVSFDDVMKAFKMPKETDEEKAARTAEIQKGMKYAASVPLETAETAFEIMKLAEAAVVRGNSNAVTDGAIAAMMGRNAVLGAILNVRINLGSIKDEAFVADLAKKCDDLEAAVQKREDEILGQVSL
jgi:formiminotetrahydrofolate cyclodeaminase